LVAVVYVACGALRLARFNVLAAHVHGASRYFVGLPIPVAAGTMTAVVMVYQQVVSGPPDSTWQIVLLVLLLSSLMISNVRFRTFKDIRFRGRTLFLIISLSLGLIVLAASVQPALALLTLFSSYVIVGLAEELIFFHRRHFKLSESNDFPSLPPTPKDDPQ
jgi:CDP-diacylglycerol---serine O-phosphatidyltransferase